MIGVLAHQGGWDEMLLAAAVVLALLGISRLRRRRGSGTPAAAIPGRALRTEEDGCAYCGAPLASTDARCASCGFRRAVG